MKELVIINKNKDVFEIKHEGDIFGYKFISPRRKEKEKINITKENYKI